MSHYHTFILLHNPIQRVTHIRPHILIPILIHAQRATRMLQKQVQQSTLDAAYLGQGGGNVVGY